MSSRSSNSLKDKLGEIIENTSDPEKLDILNISKILSDPKISNTDAKNALSLLCSSMVSNPQKSSVCLELLQYMISMCKMDILDLLCTESIISDLKNVIIKSEAKQFKLDLMDFLEKIYMQNKKNPKYSNLINLIKNYRKGGNSSSDRKNKNEDEIDADIQRAIKLSLETCPEVKNNSRTISPAVSVNRMPTNSDVPYTSVVLFDFVAEEPGELSVKTGETITVLEKCNDSWWKGQIGNRIGVFPSNFVSPKPGTDVLSQKTVENCINEDLMNQCLMMLVDADPIYAGENEGTIKELEASCKIMEIEAKKHLEELKNQNQKYAILDKEYNETIQAYLALIEKSRTMNDTARQHPVYPYSQPQGYMPEDVYRPQGPYEPHHYGDSDY